jgi:adenylylsulfate kinase-like enzyme
MVLAPRVKDYAQLYKSLARTLENLRVYGMSQDQVRAQVLVLGFYRSPRTGEVRRVCKAVQVPADEPWTSVLALRCAQTAERRMRAQYPGLRFIKVDARFTAYREETGSRQ